MEQLFGKKSGKSSQSKMSASPDKQEQENDASTLDKDKFQLINSDFKTHYVIIQQEIEESGTISTCELLLIWQFLPNR